MAEDISKKILLIDIQLKSQEADAGLNKTAQAIIDLQKQMDDLTVATVRLKGAKKQDSVEWIQLQSEIRKTSAALKNAKKDFDGTKKTVDDIKVSVNAASGSYAEAQKRLSALGKEIRNTENGFKSTSPALKAQIKEYNQLNGQLKKFDASMGNHQRSVGHYTTALGGLSQALNQIIPGFSKFSGILMGATRGFNAMGVSGAKAGEDVAGAEGLISSGAVGVIASIAAIIAAIAAEGTYLLQFQKYVDGLATSWAGVKASALEAMTVINKPGSKSNDSVGFFVNLGIQMSQAFNQAKVAKQGIIDLGREAKNAQTLTQAEDSQVQLNLKMIRDRTTGAAEAQKLYTESLKINAGQYERNHAIAVKMYRTELDAALAGYDLTGKQVEKLNVLKYGYEGVLKYAKELVYTQKVNADFLDTINPALQGIITVDNKKIQSDAMLKIRDDMKQSREATAAQKQISLQDQITAAIKQTESEKIASIAKTLQFKQEAFGNELSTTDEHYRQLIFKQEQFIEKQNSIIKNPKNNAKTKGLAKKAIGTSNEAIKQIEIEKNAALEKLTQDHNIKMFDELVKSGEALKSLEVANIEDLHKKELAGIDQKREVQLNAYQKESEDLATQIDKLKEQADTASGNDKDALVLTINRLTQLQKDEDAKDLQNQIASNNAKLDANKKFQDQILQQADNIALLKAENASGKIGSKANDKALLSAQQQSLLDQFNIEVSQKELTDQRKLELEQDYLNKRDSLNQQYDKKHNLNLLDATKLGFNTTFTLLQNSLQRDAQANQTYMDLNKNRELQNSSLTSTQKIAINEKYRVAEGQAKVKEFRANQKMAIAQALINGALAMVKTTANVGFPLAFAFDPIVAAQTAVEVAVIASQKPPAYATGGLHYKSDGMGAMLRGPGSGKSDSMNARLSNGEAVINERSTSWFAPLLSAINVAGGGKSFDSRSPQWFSPGFATGGLFNSYMPTSDNGLRPSAMINTTARIHPNDIDSITTAIGNMRPIVDVKDINYSQGQLTQVQDRASYS